MLWKHINLRILGLKVYIIVHESLVGSMSNASLVHIIEVLNECHKSINIEMEMLVEHNKCICI